MSPLWCATLGELIGFLLAAYGLVRQSFADLAQQVGYGQDRYGESTYGGGLTKRERLAVGLAISFRLLPPDRALTIHDKKLNATLAVCGVVIGAVALASELFLTR